MRRLVRGSCARLMRKGGRESMMSWQDGWYPLIWAAKDGNTALVSQLIDRGMDVNQMEEEKSSQGFTPLMWAASRGHEATVHLLLPPLLLLRLQLVLGQQVDAVRVDPLAALLLLRARLLPGKVVNV